MSSSLQKDTILLSCIAIYLLPLNQAMFGERLVNELSVLEHARVGSLVLHWYSDRDTELLCPIEDEVGVAKELASNADLQTAEEGAVSAELESS